MTLHFIETEDGGVRAVSLLEWARMFDEDPDKRRVAETLFEGVRVSTVFLGLDHRMTMEGPPILYETMVFGGAMDGEMDRYATRLEALAGHEDMVARVQRSLS
jgi:hypothetical protein